MSERTLQFRVGLFVIVSACLAAAFVFQLGETRSLFERYYEVAINFSEAPGIEVGTPVRKNGVRIGSVSRVFFDEERGGVTVTANIQQRFALRKDSRPRLTQSVLGDATVEFSPGRSKEFLKPGAQVTGEAPASLMAIINRMERQVGDAIESLEGTSDEWQKVAANLNSLMDTNRGNLDLVIERTAESMHEFSQTMRNANSVLGDPETQKNLQRTVKMLPEMVRDTRDAIVTIKAAVETADQNLENLREVTGPLAKRSESIAGKLDRSLGNLDVLLGELAQFSRLLSSEDGSLRKLASDPDLYRNLNRSAGSLDTLLRNLQPVSEDLRVLSDKLARHPELLGVGGALRGSSGVKSEPMQRPAPQTTRAPKQAPR
jgi:phospholipid/cholesterol/gamma-HCH transport system substrate-binding protein